MSNSVSSETWRIAATAAGNQGLDAPLISPFPAEAPKPGRGSLDLKVEAEDKRGKI